MAAWNNTMFSCFMSDYGEAAASLQEAFCTEGAVTEFSLAGSHWTPSRRSSGPAACQRREAEIADSAALRIPVQETRKRRPSDEQNENVSGRCLCPHLGLSPYGGEFLRVLVGLHLVLSPPGWQVKGGDDRHHLLEACGCQRHSHGRCRG